jgi:hypothetical protein
MRIASPKLMAVLLGAALLAGCGTAGGPGTADSKLSIPLSSAQLSSYTATYTIKGTQSGSETVQVQEAAGGSVQVSQHTAVGSQREDDSFSLTARGLILRSASERITAPGTDVTIAAHPSGNVMQENATVNGRVETPTIALQKPWQVNGVLLTALSGIALRAGETATLEDVTLKHATSAPIGISVGNEETVSTAIGKVACFPLTITAGGNVQTAWYEAAAPHVLMKYVNGPETSEISTLKR